MSVNLPNQRRALNVAARLVISGLLAATTVPPATAAWADLTVSVYQHGYVWAGRAFDDLDDLAQTVLPRSPRSIALLSCGAGSVRPLLAASHRFRLLPLELIASDADTAECVGALPRLQPASLRTPQAVRGARELSFTRAPSRFSSRSRPSARRSRRSKSSWGSACSGA